MTTKKKKMTTTMTTMTTMTMTMTKMTTIDGCDRSGRIFMLPVIDS